ncbi:Nucleoporin AMO1 [Pseudolycoriella hygida]|uniref:Nucleoporin NUP42 n=1 Tax=Pseudolycoriella hygida TaxID=35572 RepID=A0A9Q0MH96_9DIPT|nr:Nucleoporin AMO1 [Pseudolycoriella hygida]
MVICKYYLTNSCNFGAQCKNEHINVASAVKTDAESAMKGKQWMLSSYGPFKDKPSLPNFEDQSFEEIRFLCYEAKNNNKLQILLPQLSQKIADASYKMTMLCDQNNVNNNLLNVLVNLYNTGEPVANAQTNYSTGNPFAISSGASGQTPNLFGSSAMSSQNPFSSSLFGSATPTSSLSQGNFGGSNSTSNSLFGQQSTFGANGTGVFGTQSTFASGSLPNSFGTSTFGQPSASASTFSLSQIGQPTDTSIQSNNVGTSQFQQTHNSIFGTASAFGNHIQPTKPSGLFSSATTNSFFSQPTASPTLFGQANAATNQPANTENIFAQPQLQSQGLFAQSTNINSNIFQSNQQEVNGSSSIFSNVLPQDNSANVFGVQYQPEKQLSIFNQPNNPNSGANIFQSQANDGNIFGSSGGFSQSVQESQSVYSKLEDLNPQDLKWFKEEGFTLGHIPTIPPPKELCV